MKKILFISSNIHTPWGGSELLWYKTAVHLKKEGTDVEVGVATRKWPAIPRHIQEISEAGGRIFDLPVPPLTPFEYLKEKIRGSIEERTKVLIQKFSPDLILHSMGKSFEGGHIMNLAHHLKVPYINLVHLSSELQWPENSEIDLYLEGYANAYRNFFVAEKNREIVCKQLGFEVPNSSIVRNPIAVSGKILPYPDAKQGHHLALPALLVPIHKGQDVLFEVMAQEKWKKRSLHLNLYGDGGYSRTLQNYCQFLGLRNVHFMGYTNNVEEVWERNHALIMGSRMEGLPLTLFEAMACGRPAIVTNVAGMGECIQDGETGFVARSAHPEAMDETLERAWQQRERWELIGRQAASKLKEIVPFEPVEEFARILLDLMEG